MKTTKPNAERVWKELEDFLVPRLALSVVDRAVYSHLLRHSRLEGKLRLRFSIAWLARGTRLSEAAARMAVHRLLREGALRLIERSKAGHVIEVRLPGEICRTRRRRNGAGSNGRPAGRCNLEEINFQQTPALRDAIHSRERDLCFYCLRRTCARTRSLDHVVPRLELGSNSYRNLVSVCVECNSRKGSSSAAGFLRWLYREGRLTAAELTTRLRALDALAAGKLRPVLDTSANPLPRRSRSLLHP